MYRVDKEDLRKIILELSVLRCRIQDHQNAAQQELDRLVEARDYNHMDRVDNNVLYLDNAADYVQCVIDELKNVK